MKRSPGSQTLQKSDSKTGLPQQKTGTFPGNDTGAFPSPSGNHPPENHMSSRQEKRSVLMQRKRLMIHSTCTLSATLNSQIKRARGSNGSMTSLMCRSTLALLHLHHLDTPRKTKSSSMRTFQSPESMKAKTR